MKISHPDKTLRRMIRAIFGLACCGTMLIWCTTPRDLRAQDLEPPAHENYLPLTYIIDDMDGRVYSGIQVQNLSQEHATDVTIDVRAMSGPSRALYSRPDIPAEKSATVYLPAERSSLDGPLSALLQADNPIASIARTDWLPSGGAAIYSNALPGTEIIVPLALKAAGGQHSVVAIQNTDSQVEAKVIAEFFIAGSVRANATTNYSIRPGNAVQIDLNESPDFAGLAHGSIGMMKIRSISTNNNPKPAEIAVVSTIHNLNRPKAVSAFEGVPSDRASDKLFVPLFRNNYYGTSGISVVNPGPEPVDVTLTYHASPEAACSGSMVHNDRPQTIAAGSSEVFYQGNIDSLPTGPSRLPSDCFGSATIEAENGKIMAVVNDANSSAGSSAAYNAFTMEEGASLVALPLVRNKHTALKLTTGIQVMNLGDQPATIKLEFEKEVGTIPSTLADLTVDPLISRNFYLGHPHSGFMPDSYSSGTIESDQPIVVIANEFSEAARSDSAIYSGIKVR